MLTNCREFTIGIHEFFGNLETLPICEVITYGALCTFDMKNSNSAKFDKIMPACVDKHLETKLIDATIAAYKAIGADMYARVDLMVDTNNNVYVLEINTLPGLMPKSVLPKEFQLIGIEYEQMIQLLIEHSHLPKRQEPKKLLNNHPQLSEDIIASMTE